jgi:energy-coupling factor transporter transmembrane protein EcfT
LWWSPTFDKGNIANDSSIKETLSHTLEMGHKYIYFVILCCCRFFLFVFLLFQFCLLFCLFPFFVASALFVMLLSFFQF